MDHRKRERELHCEADNEIEIHCGSKTLWIKDSVDQRKRKIHRGANNEGKEIMRERFTVDHSVGD